eukprot:gb/GECH01012822.1/.p1 GENE.gb/GECH01012822.1/~~gb/GECH01012822.1/.p1  ORF type:complete len:288 (+),score=48.98 gb/GECH01012822.1/:1-864(+)
MSRTEEDTDSNQQIKIVDDDCEKVYHAISKRLNLTEEEKEMCNGTCLCRFLRARKGSINNAAKMLEKTILWRREYQPARIPVSDVKWQAKDGKNYIRGRDRHGRPVIWMRARLDTPYAAEQKLKLIVFQVEQATQIADRENSDGKIDFVADLRDMSYHTVSEVSAAKQVVDVMQNHYPERLGYFLVVDAPWLFNTLWRIVKPLVDPETRQKVHFLKANHPEELWPQFSTFFDRDQVETEYGGTCEYEYQHDVYWEPFLEQEKERERSISEKTDNDQQNGQSKNFDQN